MVGRETQLSRPEYEQQPEGDRIRAQPGEAEPIVISERDRETHSVNP